MRETARRVIKAPFAAYLRPSWIILALALTLTALATWATYRAVASTAARQFENETATISNTISNVMRTYVQILRSGAGLFNVKRDVSRENWSTFIASLDLPGNFPGVQGIGYAEVIPGDKLQEHISAQRRDGRPDYDVRPPGQRDPYTSIIYLEPQDVRNVAAIGFDMHSEPTRREAMDLARDSQSVQMTRHVTLVQEIDGDVQPGVLVYVPVYAAGANTTTVEGRRAGLKGYVYAAFRMHDLFAKSLLVLNPRALQFIEVRIFDAPKEKGGHLLFDSTDKPVTRSTFRKARTMEIAGQKWALEFVPRPDLDNSINWWQPYAVALIGSIISGLIASIAATLAVSRDRAVEAQAVLEQEVSMRKRAQEQERIANRELIHRVKNMMAVVASIASQTSRYTPNPAQFNVVFRERLAALGRVHDMLKPNPAFQPDLKTLLLEVLQPYAAYRASSLSCHGPEVELPQNEAVMLSLVINELGTNATKYGAWSLPGGTVELSWTVEKAADGDPDQVTMVWKERGGPQVVAPTHKGFGSNVLKFAVQRGLKGSLDSSYEPDGLRCTISFPLAEAAGPAQTDASTQQP